METKLVKMVKDGLTTYEMAEVLGMSQTNVRYHLKKYGLKSLNPRGHKLQDCGTGVCDLCARDVKGRSKYCNSCVTKIRRTRTKLSAIKHLGGVCVKCGEGDFRVLEFHHLHGKDFGIGDAANRSWALMKKELSKCELLCANCHRRHHNTRGDEKLLEAVAAYKGILLNFD